MHSPRGPDSNFSRHHAMNIHHSAIEPLEPRIAPASLVGNVLTYTDLDGDLVKVTFTKAAMVAGDFTFSTGTANDGLDTPRSLDSIDMNGQRGGGFILTATPHGGKGDSHANLGTIMANLTDLGTVKVDGDVAKVLAGSGDPGAVGLKSFTALSMGKNSQISTTSTISNAGTFTVKTDLINSAIDFYGGVKAVSIGGNIEAVGSGGYSEIFVSGNLGTLTIGGSILTSSEVQIRDGTSAGTIKIGGSLDGSQIRVEQPLKSLTIRGDVLGRAGKSYSGVIRLFDGVGSIKIGGSLLGADNTSYNGFVETTTAGSITIGGSVRSGTFTLNDTFGANGVIAADKVGTLAIGGDLIADVNTSGHTTFATGGINIDGTVGTLTIGGSILGDATNRVLISAGANGTTGPVNAIKTLTVKHSVRYGSLLAGYNGGAARNLESGFGSITVGGEFRGSFITAGSDKGSDGIPGNTDDHTVNTTATVGSVKIGGAFTGIAGSSLTYYIFAPIVKKVAIGKAIYTHDQLAGHPVEFNSIGKAAITSVN